MQYPLGNGAPYCYCDSMDARGFPERLRKAREAREMGSYELARRIGKGGSYISMIETGARKREAFPDGDVMVAIADELGVTLDYLFGRESSDGESPDQALRRRHLEMAGQFIAAMPREALLAASRLPGMPDVSKAPNVAAIIAYVEAKPDARFLDWLAGRRAALLAPVYVRGCIRIYAAWSSNAELLLEGLEILFPAE